MNDDELIKKYLSYVKKRRCVIVIILFVTIFFIQDFLKINNKLKEANTIDNTDVEIKKEIDNNNFIQNNKKNSSDEEQKIENNKLLNNKNEIKKEANITTNNSSERKEESNVEKQKPANKDFLFIDGYTMDNVSQIAQDYLNSTGCRGRCVPLKDDEGVYIGMSVIIENY